MWVSIHAHVLASACLVSPLNPPSQADWVVLVGEHDRDVLEWAACVNQSSLVLCYLRDVKVCVCMCVRA